MAASEDHEATGNAPHQQQISSAYKAQAETLMNQLEDIQAMCEQLVNLFRIYSSLEKSEESIPNLKELQAAVEVMTGKLESGSLCPNPDDHTRIQTWIGAHNKLLEVCKKQKGTMVQKNDKIKENEKKLEEMKEEISKLTQQLANRGGQQQKKKNP